MQQKIYMIDCFDGPPQPVTPSEFNSLIERGQITIAAKHGREKLLAAISEYHAAQPKDASTEERRAAASGAAVSE